MGYWYCKAKKHEWQEVVVRKKGWFGTKNTTTKKLVTRVVEGKVLGMSNDGGYGSFDAITIVTSEGKNPSLESISYELGVPSKRPGDYLGEFDTDEILELTWCKD